MDDVLTIELPNTLSKTEVKGLRDEIRQLNEVVDADSQIARGVDAVTLGIWIQLATDIFGAVGSGMPIVQKIVELVRGKGIKGAKIVLANGGSVSVDEISVKDLERIIRASAEQGGTKPAGKSG